MDKNLLISVLVGYIVFDLLLSIVIYNDHPDQWNIINGYFTKPITFIFLIIAIVVAFLVYNWFWF